MPEYPECVTLYCTICDEFFGSNEEHEGTKRHKEKLKEVMKEFHVVESTRKGDLILKRVIILILMLIKN